MDACMAERGGVGGRAEADGGDAGEDVETTTLGLKVETDSEDGEEMELVGEVRKARPQVGKAEKQVVRMAI